MKHVNDYIIRINFSPDLKIGANSSSPLKWTEDQFQSSSDDLGF